jgi:ComF family protein
MRNRARSGIPGRFVFRSTDDPNRRQGLEKEGRGRFIASFLGGLAEGVFATIFPSGCRLCGAPLQRISRLPVCPNCLASVIRREEKLCSICGQRRAVSAEETRCPECIRSQPPYLSASAYGNYDGVLRDLVHLLKYQHVLPVAGVLGCMLAETIADLVPRFGPVPPLLVVVPLHKTKLRQRGFNQSEAIARAAVKELKTPRLAVSSSVLTRRRATESQTGLSRAQRRLNVRGAFNVARPNEIAGRDILLVDDVFTTGTTVAECARVLRRAGCARIWVATVATVLMSDASFEAATEVAWAASAGHA